MNVPILERHIEITPGLAGGKPQIAGRRITVQNIAIRHEYMGLSADEIAAEHDLSLADVYAALAYYFDHREDIERQMAEDENFVEMLRAQTASRLQKKLNSQDLE